MELYDLAWSERITGPDRDEFLQKVIDKSNERNINPNWAMDIMRNESGFSATITNGIGCTGLIQFCKDNIAKYVYTTSSTNRVRQLDGVFQYWDDVAKIYPGTYDNVESMYMATFFPAFVPFMDYPDDTVIQGYGFSAQILAQQNPGFDLNKNGQITVGEFKQFCRQNFSPKSFQKAGLFGIEWKYIVIAGALIASILIIQFRKPLTAFFKKTFR